MHKKFNFGQCDFTITNVCNFNCPRCNRLNNYHFSGNHYWKDYKNIYKKWAERVDMTEWALLGGEPLTNNDWLDWFIGINELWPTVPGKLITNGSLLLHPKNKKKLEVLYNFMASRNGLLEITISLHNPDRKNEMIDFVKGFLKGRIYPNTVPSFNDIFCQNYKNIKAEDWPDCTSFYHWDDMPAYIKEECDKDFDFSIEKEIKKQTINNTSAENFIFEDSNRVRVEIWLESNFYRPVAQLNAATNTFYLHNNPPDTAFKKCIIARLPAPPQFIEGKLYKCATSRILKDFDEQYTIDISDADRQLIKNYQPLTLSQSDDDFEKWGNDLKHPIELCKFCTIDVGLCDREPMAASTKKIFIQKKSKS